MEDAISVTARISGAFERRGYYSELIRLNLELLGLEKQSWSYCLYRPSLSGSRANTERQKSGMGGPCRSPLTPPVPGLGMALMHQEKHDKARESMQKAEEAYRAAGDVSGEAASISRLAAIDMLKDENDAALEKLQKIAEIMKSLGDVQGGGFCFAGDGPPGYGQE